MTVVEAVSYFDRRGKILRVVQIFLRLLSAMTHKGEGL